MRNRVFRGTFRILPRGILYDLLKKLRKDHDFYHRELNLYSSQLGMYDPPADKDWLKQEVVECKVKLLTIVELLREIETLLNKDFIYANPTSIHDHIPECRDMEIEVVIVEDNKNG